MNRPEPAADLEALRTSSQRGRRFGALQWRDEMIRRFALDSTLRPRGTRSRRTKEVPLYFSGMSSRTDS